MTKELRTLPKDVYELFNPNTHHVVDESNLEQFGEAVKELVRVRLKQRESSNGDPLRFSNLGRPDRQLWFKANKPELEEQMIPKTFLKFLYGDLIEQLMILLIKEAGHTVSNEQDTVECEGVIGHIDCVIDGHVCDVKSASPHSYFKFESGKLLEDDPFGYIGQISSYNEAVGLETTPAFVAFDKVHGDICVLEVPNETHDTKLRVNHLKEVIASKEMPPRCYEDIEDGKSGNRKLATNCSYCGFKHSCWNGLRTFIYSNGPRYLTSVSRTPDVPEIGRNEQHIEEF